MNPFRNTYGFGINPRPSFSNFLRELPATRSTGPLVSSLLACIACRPFRHSVQAERVTRWYRRRTKNVWLGSVPIAILQLVVKYARATGNNSLMRELPQRNWETRKLYVVSSDRYGDSLISSTDLTCGCSSSGCSSWFFCFFFYFLASTWRTWPCLYHAIDYDIRRMLWKSQSEQRPQLHQQSLWRRQWQTQTSLNWMFLSRMNRVFPKLNCICVFLVVYLKQAVQSSKLNVRCGIQAIVFQIAQFLHAYWLVWWWPCLPNGLTWQHYKSLSCLVRK